jgi:hypothetical protein
VLLIGDWAWDTHFGTDAFSRPMSSSNVTRCTSLGRSSRGLREDGSCALDQLTPLVSVLPLVAPQFVPAFSSKDQFPSCHQDPLYLFMSLRC